MENKKFILAVYVDNQAGALTRITSMFTRRGFNIDTLTAAETENSGFARVTVAMTGDEYEIGRAHV